MDEELYNFDKKEKLLIAVVIVGIVIAYLIFSYGKYIECVKPIEISTIQKIPESIIDGKIKNNYFPVGLPNSVYDCKFPYLP